MVYLAEIMAQARSRSSWNDRLSHWERPASDSEEAQIERAAAMVRKALAANTWLSDEGVTVAPQGSYFNNTNVRRTADQDLRAIHPLTRLLCPEAVERAAALRQLNFVNSPRTFDEVMSRMRREIDAALAAAFGTQNIDASGKKATRVIELPGSRAPVDVVPTFRHVWTQTNSLGGIFPQDGVSILSKDGKWTNNFPVQHSANGIAKRARTQHRFKKAVRSLKRLRDELETMGVLQPKQCPSFLIECLVYQVPDNVFLWTEADQRYERICHIVDQIVINVCNDEWVKSALEINDLKYLFHASQGWSIKNAKAFALAAHSRLRGG